jgi:hypothetical protein
MKSAARSAPGFAGGFFGNVRVRDASTRLSNILGRMTNPSVRPRLSTRLLRSFCEWATIAFGTLSVVCLAYWFVSISTSRADLAPLEFDPYSGEIVSTGNGKLSVRTSLEHTADWLEQYANRPVGNRSGIKSDRKLILPGIAYRYLSLDEDSYRSSYWAVEVSFAILSVLSAAITATCFLAYRILRRKTAVRQLEQ